MTRTLLCLLVFASATASAQNQFEGLDLSDDGKKDESKKDDSSSAADSAKSSTSSSTSSGSSAAAPADKPKKDSAAVERDITQEDRVKAVQKKLYLKRYRFELAPYFSFSLNDPFYTKIAGTIRGAFYLSDTVAFSARFSYFGVRGTIPTEDVRIARNVLGARIFYSIPIWWAMGAFEWSPFYGKFAIFNSILFIDGYLSVGGGAVYTETTPVQSMKPAFDLGGGLRFVVRDWLAVNVALINTTYVDAPAGTTKASTQNLMMMNVGLSIFFPFKSTFREAE